MRRVTNEYAYKVETPVNGTYLVVMETLKNDIYGHPRSKARIINIENPSAVYVYTFTCHYLGEEGEARWIVERHLEEVAKRK